MGIVVRQSLKSAILTLAGAALGGVVMLLSISVFGKQDYGFQQSLQKYATLISYFCILGYNYTVLIFGQKYDSKHPARGVFLRLTFVIPLIVAIITAVLMLLLKPLLLGMFKPEDIPLMDRYYLFFPIFMVITVVMMWLEGYLQSVHKSAIQNFIREILLRIINMALIGLFFADIIDFDGFVALFVLLYILPVLLLVVVARKSSGFHFKGSKELLSKAERNEIYKFSAYHMLGVVGVVLIFQMDALLIPPFSKNGLEDAAVYATAIFAVALMRNPARVIGVAATPAFTQTYNEGNIRELASLYSRSSVNMQITALIMFLLIALNLDSAMILLAQVKPGYEMVKPLILVLMIGQVIEMGAGPNFELIGVTKYYRFNFWIAIALLAAIIVLNVWLIQQFGIIGAAWATTSGLALFNIAKALFLWKKLKIQPFTNATWKIIAIGIVIGVAVWFIPFLGNVYLDIALRSTLSGLMLWLLLYRFNVSPELSEITRNIIYKRKLF